MTAGPFLGSHKAVPWRPLVSRPGSLGNLLAPLDPSWDLLGIPWALSGVKLLITGQFLVSRGGYLGPVGLPSGVSWKVSGHIGSPLEPLEKSLGPFWNQTFDYGTLFGASRRFPGAHWPPV